MTPSPDIDCIVSYKDGCLEMLCPNCGKSTSDSSIFCNWCGFKVAQANTPLLVEDVFDPQKGWDVGHSELQVQKTYSSDGNPVFVVTLAGVEMGVYQQTRWSPDADPELAEVSPGRIVVQSNFAGFTLQNPELLLQDNYTVRGLLTWGIEEDRTMWLFSSFPVEPNFPVEVVRKQTLVGLALVAKEAARCIVAWTSPENLASLQSADAKNVDWDFAQNVARVAGSLVRGFVSG